MPPAPLRRLGEAALRSKDVDRLLRPALVRVRAAGWQATQMAETAAEAARRRRSGSAVTMVAGDAALIAAGERVAVLAEFSRGAEVRPWAVRMAGALAAAGYPCIIVAARSRAARVEAPAELPAGVAVVSRGNARLDFGSWAAALEAFPTLLEARHVLLTNDSIIGPLGDEGQVAALLSRGEASGADVFGATRGLTGSDHLQSFWLQFNGSLGHPAVAGFLADLPATTDRSDLNVRYEIGLSTLMREQGLTLGWAWDASSFGLPPHYNPSLCWRDLLAAGFPFVKRKLLSDHPRFREARREVLEHARAHFGADLA